MEIIYLIIALAACISIHESAHAWVAYKLGDPTAKMAGRVSLNPARHLDILGTIMIFIAHFGWGKPVPFNYNNLKNPRRDVALIAIAGPLSNLLTALVIIVIFKYINLPLIIFSILKTIFDLSIILMLFNLIPIAPLDGSKLLGLVIPRSKEDWYQRYLAQGPMFIIIFIVADHLMESISGFSLLKTYFIFGYELITVSISLIT